MCKFAVYVYITGHAQLGASYQTFTRMNMFLEVWTAQNINEINYLFIKEMI